MTENTNLLKRPDKPEILEIPAHRTKQRCPTCQNLIFEDDESFFCRKCGWEEFK
jgi:transposase